MTGDEEHRPKTPEPEPEPEEKPDPADAHENKYNVQQFGNEIIYQD